MIGINTKHRRRFFDVYREYLGQVTPTRGLKARNMAPSAPQ